MFQIIDAITTTCMKYAEDYLPWAVAITVAIVVGGVLLRVLKRG
jgi:hypothetical protein